MSDGNPYTTPPVQPRRCDVVQMDLRYNIGHWQRHGVNQCVSPIVLSLLVMKPGFGNVSLDTLGLAVGRETRTWFSSHLERQRLQSYFLGCQMLGSSFSMV